MMDFKTDHYKAFKQTKKSTISIDRGRRELHYIPSNLVQSNHINSRNYLN